MSVRPTTVAAVPRQGTVCGHRGMRRSVPVPWPDHDMTTEHGHRAEERNRRRRWAHAGVLSTTEAVAHVTTATVDDGLGALRQSDHHQHPAAGRASDRIRDDLGVPPRIDDGHRRSAASPSRSTIQTEAVPVAMTRQATSAAAPRPVRARRSRSACRCSRGSPIRPSRASPLGLVLVPTRELAVQVAEVLEPIAEHAGQRPCCAVYGGASRHHADRRVGARASSSSSPRRCG